MKRYLMTFLLVLSFTLPIKADTFQIGPEEVVLSAQERLQQGVFFPDDNLGVVNEGGGVYHFFSSGGSYSPKSPDPNLVFGPGGELRYVGSLSQIAPDNLDSSGNPTLSLQPGFLQPPPPGNPFPYDRDYAGGGPIVKIPTASGGLALLQIYHAEYHLYPYPGSGFPFYASLGMAISYDDGKTFQKLGEILQGNQSIYDVFAATQDFGLGASNGLVEADAQGRPVLEGTDPQNVYYYCPITDGDQTLPGQCHFGGCLALARAKKADVIAAAQRGTVSPWYKYYIPGGGPPSQSVDAYFTEPGIGGHFTPILTSTIGIPTAAYDPALGDFILAHGTGNHDIVLRIGPDLFHWSDLHLVDGPIPPAGAAYASIVGTGPDPNLPGSSFYLYYTSFSPNFLDWDVGVLVRRKITITPSSLSSAVVATLDSAKVFPNPFVPSRGHSFITFGNLPSNARVQIYTVMGEKINEVVADDTGSVEWDARNASGKEAASGVYYARLEGQGQKRTMKFAIQR